MDTWTVCPHCQLKHRPREANSCPRCGRPVRSGAPAASAPAPASSPAAPEQNEPRIYPLRALRPAGVILLVNAAYALLAWTLIMRSGGHSSRVIAGASGGLFARMAIDAFLGINLLRGEDKYRKAVIVRTTLGLIVFGALSLWAREWVQAGVQVAFCGGLLLVLFGEHSPWRRRWGLAAVVACFLVDSTSLYRLLARRPLWDDVRISVRKDLAKQPLARSTFQGEQVAYHLSIPGAGTWYEREAEVARAEDAQVDRWMTEPLRHAEIIVRVKPLNEEAPPDLMAQRDALEDSMAQETPLFRSLGHHELRVGSPEPRSASFQAMTGREGEELQHEVWVFSAGKHLVTVTASAPPQAFQELNLGATGLSFTPPPPETTEE